MFLHRSCSARRKVSDAQDQGTGRLDITVRSEVSRITCEALPSEISHCKTSVFIPGKTGYLDGSANSARCGINASTPPLLYLAVQLTCCSPLITIQFTLSSANIFSNNLNNSYTTAPCPHNTMQLALLRGTHPATTSGGRFLPATLARLPERLPTYHVGTQGSRRARSILP